MTVDKAHLMHLDTDAGTIMVADPTIADVVLESPRLVFIVGRAPGETNLYILDVNGAEIVHTDLLVVPNVDREVTLDRNTVEATFSCAPRCARIATPGAAQEAEEASTADESAEAGG
ncbi:MAG: pilus assembly protein N-terminal domain-containing protein [Proteobacteria bacterium]|nr:pilus assembly protein N-terminal domain-containing protein [Pseudomonadota bacterium]MCH9018834.1 pilus assembly protein N-terminal domain-containing protein [Pseudomonadota bacterium]